MPVPIGYQESNTEGIFDLSAQPIFHTNITTGNAAAVVEYHLIPIFF